MKNNFKKYLICAIIIALFTYISIILYYYYFQASLIYHPGKNSHPLSYYIEQGELDNQVSEIFLKAKDGNKIQAWYRKPDAGKPIVLYLHGNSYSLDWRLEKLKILRKMGYGFLIISWRGFGESTGYPSVDGFFMDANAGLEFLLQNNFKEQDIIIIGESLGGGVATKIATEHRFKGLMLLTSYTSILRLGHELYPFIPMTHLLHHNFDSISYIDQINCPLLIVHGKKDTVIPYHHAEELFDKAKQPKKLLLYEEANHSNYDAANVLSEMNKFFIN